MSRPNRAALLLKTHKILKKHYSVVTPELDRPLLEHLLFACLYEGTDYETAQQGMGVLAENYFDWNEVRVSTVRELSEMLPMLRDSESAAHRIRGALQGVFESTYSFDIDGMRKQNLGKAVDMLKNFSGSTPFAISWVIQVGLGGHSIPVSEGELEALRVLGIITEAEAAKYTVPGMERAIPKAKGVEFGVLLHQLGLAFRYSPYAPSLHKILLEIEPDCREDLPKRPSRTKAKPEPEKKPEPKKQPATKKKAAVSPAKAAKKKSASSSASKKTAAKKKPTKSKPAKKTTKKTPATKKPTTSKKTAKKKSAKRS